MLRQGIVAKLRTMALAMATTGNALLLEHALMLTAPLLPIHRFLLARACVLQTVTMESKL
jgi:hypothetical protein